MVTSLRESETGDSPPPLKKSEVPLRWSLTATSPFRLLSYVPVSSSVERRRRRTRDVRPRVNYTAALRSRLQRCSEANNASRVAAGYASGGADNGKPHSGQRSVAARRSYPHFGHSPSRTRNATRPSR